MRVERPGRRHPLLMIFFTSRALAPRTSWGVSQRVRPLTTLLAVDHQSRRGDSWRLRLFHSRPKCGLPATPCSFRRAGVERCASLADKATARSAFRSHFAARQTMKFVDQVTLCYRWDVLAPVKQFVPFLIAGGLSVIVNVGSRI